MYSLGILAFINQLPENHECTVVILEFKKDIICLVWLFQMQVNIRGAISAKHYDLEKQKQESIISALLFTDWRGA